MIQWPILLVGAGGHAKVLMDALLLNDMDVIGIVDASFEKVGMRIYDIPVVGDDAYVFKNYDANKVRLVNGVGTAASVDLRKRIYMKFKNGGYTFHSVIHPQANVSPRILIEEGVQIMAGAVVQAGCRIGCNVIINTSATVDHDCQIGDHVHIAPGCTLCGSVQVGNETHIGAGTTVIQGKKIGSLTIVGAGAVVIDDIGNAEKVVGVPARRFL